MKKIFKGVLLVVIIFTIMVILPTFMDSIGIFSIRSEAEDAEWSETEVPSGTSGSTGGTPSKFLVLEIVPYKGYGEIGYLVGGQELFDEKYFTYTNASGDLGNGILNGAVSWYKTYTEQAQPASGPSYWPWNTVTNYTAQNGYFKYVGSGGAYSKNTGQTVYVRVADGTGTNRAVLTSEITGIYSESGKTNQKNVNAYFVYGKPSGVELYSTTQGYAPSFVTRNANGKGDYDYNGDTQSFYLNKGKGTYDVLFSTTSATTNVYYMRNDYEIVEDASGDYSWNIDYITGGSNCNYIKYTGGITFTSQSNGAYQWVQSDLPSSLVLTANYYPEGTAGTASEKVWIPNQKFLEKREYNYSNSLVTVVNNEYFKRLSLGIPGEYCKNYDVEVVTMTPSQLNLAENQHYLQEANMFYISCKVHNNALVELYEEKSDEGLALSDDQKYKKIKSDLNFAEDDLSWDSTMMVFNRVAGVKSDGNLGGYRAAIVYDYGFFSDAISGSGDYGGNYHKSVSVNFTWNSNGATVVNLAKLYIMTCQRDAAEFYKAFVKSSTVHPTIKKVDTNNYNSTGTTGSFIRPDSTSSGGDYADTALYWNGNTFCAYILEADGSLKAYNIYNAADNAIITAKIPNYNISKQTTDLISNVLVMNGTEIFNQFTRAVDIPDDSKSAANLYLAIQNGGTVPAFYLYNIIDYTTNEGVGYGNSQTGTTISGEDGSSGSNLRTYTSVLNIEPTADFTVSEAKIRAMLEGYNLKIVNMTCAEFNSSILDINTHFDIVYIGGGNGRFNTSSSGTVYNKAEDEADPTEKMNGSVYHKGDRIITSEGSRNYTANDITAQKKAELEEFMQAGYAVVLENNIYNLPSGAVHSSTNLYQFIQSKESPLASNLLNYADFTNSDNKTSFLVKLGICLEITRPMISMVEPVLSAGAEVNYIDVNPMTNKLTIRFQLMPKNVYEDTSISYNAYLYLDKNEDGIFAESEKMNPISSGGVLPVGITESRTTEYKYSFDMTGYNGAYQWQVKVVRRAKNASGDYYDTPIRSEITGYAACTNKQDINVLQIIDNAADTTAYPLESMVYDASSRIGYYGGFKDKELDAYNIIFDTMTVQDFLALYTAEPYSAATTEVEAATNKLSEYHLLLMDNQADGINDDHGALTNIKNEIAKGIGVVFTKGAINYTNQSTYLSNLVFANQKTYPRLSHIATPTTDDPYYIFNFGISGFNGIMNQEATYHTTFITKSNEGTDAQYPYKIGDAIKIAESSYVEDATIDYNRSDATPLIGWYSLSDSRSTVVSSAGLATVSAANVNTGIYSSSPNDVKNNYYLFNRGKTYYSGIQLKLADVPGNDAEAKLFINTIIAAYKTAGRIVAKAPSIAIEEPASISNVITLGVADVSGKSEIPIVFTIEESTSNMAVSIDWSNPSGITDSWNQKLYSVSDDGVMTELTSMTNISNGTYAVKIRVEDLVGSNVLTINAANTQGKTATLATTINYLPEQVDVTIDNTNIVKNVDKEEQYLYIDIDYASVDDEDTYLSNLNPIKLEFSVLNATSGAAISVTDASDGIGISVVGNKIYQAGSETGIDISGYAASNGSYYLYLPASVMTDKNSREIEITASIAGTSGSEKVILLRRSLFPLD